MSMRNLLVTLASLLFAAATVNGQEPPAAVPPPAPAAVPQRTLKLNLNDLVEFQQERGHAEFDLGMRRELWRDPMVRLAIGLSREQAAAARGGLVGFHGPWSASNLLVVMPGADPRLVLSGPFAPDWHDLTTQEKIGRVAEGMVYLGLIVGIVSSLR